MTVDDERLGWVPAGSARVSGADQSVAVARQRILTMGEDEVATLLERARERGEPAMAEMLESRLTQLRTMAETPSLESLRRTHRRLRRRQEENRRSPRRLRIR